MVGVFIKPESLLATTPALSAACSSHACRRLWCLPADHPSSSLPAALRQLPPLCYPPHNTLSSVPQLLLPQPSPPPASHPSRLLTPPLPPLQFRLPQTFPQSPCHAAHSSHRLTCFTWSSLSLPCSLPRCVSRLPQILCKCSGCRGLPMAARRFAAGQFERHSGCMRRRPMMTISIGPQPAVGAPRVSARPGSWLTWILGAWILLAAPPGRGSD